MFLLQLWIKTLFNFTLTGNKNTKKRPVFNFSSPTFQACNKTVVLFFYFILKSNNQMEINKQHKVIAYVTSQFYIYGKFEFHSVF